MLGSNYRLFLEHKIGEGTWGKVYLGQDVRNGKLVAIKSECKDEDIHLLKTEYALLNYAHSKTPSLDSELRLEPLWYGSDENNNYLITNLLGCSLSSLLKKCFGHFSMKTSTMLAIQIIDRIRYYHKRDIIHRDLKPANFLVDYSVSQEQICLIDFGFAKKYRHHGNHIKFKLCKQRLGTARFMSVNAHEKGEQCCKDDMYSIGYIILNFMIGKLPWSGIKEKDKRTRHREIYRRKRDITNEKLVEHVSCEDCKISEVDCSAKYNMKLYFDYLDECEFGETIEYDYLIGLFNEIMRHHNYQDDHKWCWLER